MIILLSLLWIDGKDKVSISWYWCASLSFAGISMRSSPASLNRWWRQFRSQSPARVSMRRRTPRWAMWLCKATDFLFSRSFYWFVCSHRLLLHPLQNTRENPIHIINVSIKTADTEDDDALVTAFTAFAQLKVSFIFLKTFFFPIWHVSVFQYWFENYSYFFFFFTESCPLWVWNQENNIFDCTKGN